MTEPPARHAAANEPALVQGEVHALRPSQLDTDPVAAADLLLGTLLADAADPRDARVLVRIAEVEAYGPDDPASHAFRGPTPRCASMFAAPGTAYVYRSYGVHRCLNVSVGREGTGAAVLVRAGIVLAGWELVRSRRPQGPAARALRGPGCLTVGLGIGDDVDGTNLLDGAGAWRLYHDAFEAQPRTGPRVGVSRAADRPWRRWLAGRPEVSAYRRSPRAPDRLSA